MIECNGKSVVVDSKCIDELAHSQYNMRIKGKLRIIKANLLVELEKIIRYATNERWTKDYDNKHKKSASNGWNRYDVHFSYPKNDINGNIITAERYKATMVVRINEKQELYLYDIINIKKELGGPP